MQKNIWRQKADEWLCRDSMLKELMNDKEESFRGDGSIYCHYCGDVFPEYIYVKAHEIFMSNIPQ
jgi:hypothetical protein